MIRMTEKINSWSEVGNRVKVFYIKRGFLLTVFVFFLITLSLNTQQVAFPGTEGFGGYTTGERGENLYEVINLNNSGPVSLRDALSRSNKTIEFRVSGDINLRSELKITGSNLTIYGQTTHDGGIFIRDYLTKVNKKNITMQIYAISLGDKYSLKSDPIDIND